MLLNSENDDECYTSQNDKGNIMKGFKAKANCGKVLVSVPVSNSISILKYTHKVVDVDSDFTDFSSQCQSRNTYNKYFQLL